MHFIKSIFKGISGFFLILSLALSFAPANDRENRVLGSDYTRRQIVEVRMATGALMLDQFGVLERFADHQQIPEDALRIILTDIANGRSPPDQDGATAAGTQRGIDGPRFVIAN